MLGYMVVSFVLGAVGGWLACQSYKAKADAEVKVAVADAAAVKADVTAAVDSIKNDVK
jgi:hypothetical protein